MDITINLYEKFIHDGVQADKAFKMAQQISNRPFISKKCLKCKTRECFCGEYGPFCPIGTYRGW